MRIEQSFTELSARERAFALLDAGSARELLGPFAHLKSPHLLGQGIVAQNDDGMIVVRGASRGAGAGAGDLSERRDRQARFSSLGALRVHGFRRTF